jgi:tRNA (guanine-N7-)-methyltransferase
MTRLVSDSEFKYVRSKNIYWVKLENLPQAMQGYALKDQATETHRGSWRQQFKNKTESKTAPLHVEIGCNAGHVILEWAKLNPETRYLGIDWKFKQIYRLAEKAAEHELQNLIALRANAERLSYMFAPGEIDLLCMYFPDPWPKSQQRKNRTADAEWLKSIAPLLAQKTGVFHLKTDHDEYFEFILNQLASLSDTFEIIELNRDLHASHPNPIELKIPDVTLFERLFIKDGIKIKSLKLKSKIS